MNLDLLIQELKKRGHTIYIATTRSDSDCGSGVMTISRLIRKIPENILKVGTGLTDVIIGRGIKKIIRRAKPDLVHVNDDYILPAAVHARVAGIPIVATMHQPLELDAGRAGSWPPGVGFLYRRRLRKNLECFTRISAVIAVSDFIKNSFSRLGYGIADLETIYNFPPDWPRRDPGPANDPPVLLAVGRICRYKGFETLLEAVARLIGQGQRLKLIIIGDGPDRDRLLHRIGELNLRDSVDLKKNVPYEGMAEEYAGCDIVVFPSEMEEPFGRISIEAMRMGKPVVASRIGAIPEMVDDVKTGLLFPPGDPDALVAALLRLIRDEDLRREMGRAGEKLLEEKVNTDKIVEQHLRLYERALRGVG